MVVTLILLVIASSAPAVRTADHAEATAVAGDPGADLADVFAFLDPNDNSQVILALDVEGFVVPSELLNPSFFAPEVLYRFEIENTGDTAPDLMIDITFSPLGCCRYASEWCGNGTGLVSPLAGLDESKRSSQMDEALM